MLEALDLRIRLAREVRDTTDAGTIDWLHAAMSVDTLQHLRKEVFGEFLDPSSMIYIKPKITELVSVRHD